MVIYFNKVITISAEMYSSQQPEMSALQFCPITAVLILIPEANLAQGLRNAQV